MNRQELFEWCQTRMLKEIARWSDYEESELYELMCRREEPVGPPEWERISPGQRAVIVSEAIADLVARRRVELARQVTAIGRRCFREANVLDAIVDALDRTDKSPGI